MKRFDKHNIIGIDFDGTLINSRKSALLWQYIIEHPEKEYWIITFRPENGSMGTRADILGEIFNDTVRNSIKGIAMLPEQLEHDMSNTEEFFEWKGKACNWLGCTILVDDIPNWVIPGCEKYNIEFVDTATITNG